MEGESPRVILEEGYEMTLRLYLDFNSCYTYDALI